MRRQTEVIMFRLREKHFAPFWYASVAINNKKITRFAAHYGTAGVIVISAAITCEYSELCCDDL